MSIAFGEFHLNGSALQVRGSRLRENDGVAPKLKCYCPWGGLTGNLCLPEVNLTVW